MLKLLILLILLIPISSAQYQINNTNIDYDIGSSTINFLSNQTYYSLSKGNEYINLSNSATDYINYTTPTTSGTQFRVPYIITGTYFNSISGTATISGTNRTMTYTPSYLYYDASVLDTGTYTVSKFYVTDNIGQKVITLSIPLSINVTKSNVGGSSGGSGSVGTSVTVTPTPSLVSSFLGSNTSTQIIDKVKSTTIPSWIIKVLLVSLVIIGAITVFERKSKNKGDKKYHIKSSNRNVSPVKTSNKK